MLCVCVCVLVCVHPCVCIHACVHVCKHIHIQSMLISLCLGWRVAWLHMQCSSMYVNKKLYYTNSSLAAIQLRFAPQNYTVTEGSSVNITLEAMTSFGGYEFDFTVALLYMNGSATGECVHVHKYIHTYQWLVISLNMLQLLIFLRPYFPLNSWQWLWSWSIQCDLHCWSTVCHLDGVYHWRQHNRANRVL